MGSRLIRCMSPPKLVRTLRRRSDRQQPNSPIGSRRCNNSKKNLIAEQSGRDAIGARVHFVGQPRRIKSAAGDTSSMLRPVHFGLGAADRPVSAEVDWPSGQCQIVEDVTPNRITVAREPH